MRKKPTTARSTGADEAPPLDEGFFRRAIRRHQLQPVDCGPDAPEVFKKMVVDAKGQRVELVNPRKKKRA